MGNEINKICSCEKVCPIKNENNIEFNLTENKEIISNNFPIVSNDDYILNFKESNNLTESYIDNDKDAIQEFVKLNDLRKIIKNYREHLNSIKTSENENYSNKKKYNNKYNKSLISERMEKMNIKKFTDKNNELSTKNSLDLISEKKF